MSTEEIPQEGPALSLLLDAYDHQALIAAGQDPEKYTAIELPAVSVQASNRLPNGAYAVVVQVHLPPGMFIEKSALVLAPSGIPANALDGVFGLLPKLRCVVSTDRMSEPAKRQIGEEVTRRLEAMGAGFSQPS